MTYVSLRSGAGSVQIQRHFLYQMSILSVFQVLGFVMPETARDVHRIGLSTVWIELPVYHPTGGAGLDSGISNPYALTEPKLESTPIIPRSAHPICSFLSLTASAAVSMIGYCCTARRFQGHTLGVAFFT
jgi:hypothetical protein